MTLSLSNHLAADSAAQALRRDVRDGLTQTPKSLPPTNATCASLRTRSANELPSLIVLPFRLMPISSEIFGNA